jgi:uncharacterized protein with HEPN domain
MTQRDIRDYLRDMLNAIDLAQSFVHNMTFDDGMNSDRALP